MPNVHVHLHVANLDASRAFYERFLGEEPVKVKPGYVKFLPAFAPINLAISAGQRQTGRNVDHLGIQVETRERVGELLARAKGAGLEVREEMDTNCCYANQDKFWVTDPDGLEWEVYHLNHDIDDEALADNRAPACCPPAPLVRLGKGL